MLHRARQALGRIREKGSSERGSSSLIITLILFPVIIATFGLAVDTAKATYVKQMAYDNLQSAAVAGASQINNNGNGRIVTSDARNVAIEQYTLNRANYVKSIRCAKSSDLKSGESLRGPSNCRWILAGFERDPGNYKQIRMTVREFVKNDWIGIVGVKEFPISITTEASVVSN